MQPDQRLSATRLFDADQVIVLPQQYEVIMRVTSDLKIIGSSIWLPTATTNATTTTRATTGTRTTILPVTTPPAILNATTI